MTPTKFSIFRYYTRELIDMTARRDDNAIRGLVFVFGPYVLVALVILLIVGLA